MKRLVVFLVFAALTGAGLLGDDLVVKRCEEAPCIDGKLDDAAWSNAVAAGEFRAVRNGNLAPKHTAMVTFDDAWLYVAFEVEQSDIERQEPRYSQGHDVNIEVDDCVMVSFDPTGKADPWYHFGVNRANCRRDVRIAPDGEQSIEDWNIPWKSAARDSEQKWMAEMAIPFSAMPPCNNLDKARINLVILTQVVERDEHGVAVKRPVREQVSLGPVKKTWNDPANFVAVKGLAGLKVKSSFLPLVESAKIASYREKNDSYFYGIDLDTKNMGSESGSVTLKVEDAPVSGEPSMTEEELALDANAGAKLHTVEVPAKSLINRSVVLRVLDASSGEEWQEFEFSGWATCILNLFEGYLDRNYYTSEDNAAAILHVGLPEEDLAGFMVTAEDGKGKGLAKTTKVLPDTRLAIPLKDVEIGATPVTVRLTNDKKKELSAVTLNLVKRKPNPGCEWKLDRVNRVILNNGKPFFGMGFTCHNLGFNEHETLKKLKDAGFNFLMVWTAYDADGMQRYAELFEFEGMYMMPVPDDAAAGFRGPYTFKHDKAMWCKPDSVTQMKNHMVGHGFAQVPREQRNEVFREYLDYLMPDMLGIADVAARSPAVLCYFIFDEPQIGFFDQGIIGRELYDKINKVDGYHPILVNYSSHIHGSDQATSFMDILAADPYWVPAAPQRGIRGTVNWVSMIAARTRAHGWQRRLATWIVPMCTGWSSTIKRGVTREEQFCQTYLAAIHGASGIMYFTLSSAKGNDGAWEATSAVAAQFRDVLGPACVSPMVDQKISYFTKGTDGNRLPVDYDPINGEFADIQVALKRDNPEGGYILMAANSRYYPVGCEIGVKGLTVDGIKRYFGDERYEVEDTRFTDAYKAHDVRAYRLPELPEPVEIEVTSIPPSVIPGPEQTVAWREHKKNKLSNGSFEECSVKGGLPDYCFTQNRGSSWGSRIFVDTAEAKFGKKSIRMAPSSYIQQVVMPPPGVNPNGQYTLSVWLKGSKPGQVIIREMHTDCVNKSIQVTTDWKRYDFFFVVSGNPRRLTFMVYAVNSWLTLWVDGMQLERGMGATDFEGSESEKEEDMESIIEDLGGGL